MTIHWFLSRSVRQASELRRHVRKLMNHQRDLLSFEALRALEKAIADLHQAERTTPDKLRLAARMTELETVANRWLKPYPHAAWRENVEVFLVAIAVAVGIRTFFLQPFKIPTGSMQPTLYGVTSNPDFGRTRDFPDDLRPKPDFAIPGFVARFLDFWVHGTGYTHVVARADGTLRAYDRAPQRFLLFNLKQRFFLENDPQAYTVWFPPDNLLLRAGLINHYGQPNPRLFRKGEDIIKLKSVSGDHLFVDRVTYNFRRPERGEIIVFQTLGIMALPQDQFYIKRLVALGGEQVGIGNNQHLVIDGRQLDASTPRFENVYTFTKPWRENQYFGHVNNAVGKEVLNNRYADLAPLFADEKAVFTVPPREYLVMGDNTMNSHDSRAWGSFPRTNVIGKSWFVYWPITERFGWAHR